MDDITINYREISSILIFEEEDKQRCSTTYTDGSLVIL
jgi:hypothetical protein